MKKNFLNKKIKIFSLSTLAFGLLIPVVATTAVACANPAPINKNPVGQNNQTISAIQSIHANDLGFEGTASSNLDSIANDTDNFAFKNLNKFLSGDVSLITKNDISVKNVKVNPNKTSISFDLVIAPKKFYFNNKLSEKEFSQTITISGFQVLEVPEISPQPIPPPQPTPPVIIPNPSEEALPTPKPDIPSPEVPLPPSSDVSTPNPSPDIDSTPPEDVNHPSMSTPFKVYNKFSDLINPNLNFINKNFKAESLANGMYRKNYRLHQLFKNALWKFDKVSNSFSWTIDEQWITNMALRDGDNVNNVNLYLYIENLTPENVKEIDFPSRVLFRDYLEKKTTSNHIAELESVQRYSNTKRHYPLGVQIDWEKLKTSKIINISTPKYFDVKVEYDSALKNISFQILAKKGITLTDEPALAKKADHVFISSADNFLGLSFETNNNENKTIKKFLLPSKAEEGVNVNAFDRTTRLKNSKENRYIESGFRIPQENLEDPLVSEMNSRALSISNGKTGTYTMFQKVKPSDPTDMRYYLFTNQHVFAIKENNYEQEKASGFRLVKLINNQDFKFTVRSKAFTPFWGFQNFKTRWGEDKQNLTEYDEGGIVKNWERDVSVSIIDLKLVLADIEAALLKNQNKIQTGEIKQEILNLKALKAEFLKWSSFPPLEFTDRYKGLTSFSEYLEDAIMINYPKGVFINSQINKFSGPDSLIVFKSEKGEPTLLGGGSSGSLVISRDRKIIGILNKGLSREDGIGQLFYSYLYDVIGSNIDSSNPSENANPATFAKAVIEAHKKYPNRFEMLDIFKDKNKL